jgi:autotransporter-associated beta strand protein
LQNTTTNQLRLQASDDTTNYVFSRDLDFSGANDTAARVGRSRFGISGDGAGGLNTNTLTVSGAVTLPSTNRGVEFLAARQAQTIRFTGAINTASGGTGTIFWGPGAPGGVNSDGRTNGTYRFSDLARTYTNTQNLTNGTVIIEASVGATNAASPIGTQTFNLADGNGGNLFSANTEGANRRIFLEAAETSFNRTLSPGQGTGTDLSSLSSANQARYGNSGFQRAMNGYEFGGLNTTGKITYLQNIAAQNVSVPATGTAAGAGGTNPVTTVHNFALTAANGGTVEFTGVISGGTRPVLGPTDTPGAAVSANNARVTINQFRNHPNLDSNLDGLPDANADALVGTPTNGTVILGGANTYGGTTEVLGGALLVNGSIAGDTVTVAPGAALGGTGTINPGLAGSTVQINGILAPGASAGELTINKNLSFNSGSTFSLELDGLASGVLGGYDQLTIGPGATISLNSAANVALTLNFAPAINDSFTVIDNLGAGAIGGTFANLANFGSISADFGGQTYTFQANYSGGDGNDLTLTVVPEPSAILALLSGMSLLAIRRQRSS